MLSGDAAVVMDFGAIGAPRLHHRIRAGDGDQLVELRRKYREIMSHDVASVDKDERLETVLETMTKRLK